MIRVSCAEANENAVHKNKEIRIFFTIKYLDIKIKRTGKCTIKHKGLSSYPHLNLKEKGIITAHLIRFMYFYILKKGYTHLIAGAFFNE